MIEPLDIEVLDNKKVILYDIVDYENNIANRIISEEKKRKIEKMKNLAISYEKISSHFLQILGGLIIN